ncbi:MAG: NAD(P)/FAD-dependent oxidoreductase [Methylobacillus sp.]|jgi:NADH dehydrogenase|nr:NAD(P)/FAD-dependent oxidoreductase [Methylobacillus sp.]
MALNSPKPVIPHHVVIVGGGAGGLELATRLGDKLGKRGKAVITLVDRTTTHLWKPLLHEVAAGSMDIDQHELEYLAQARWHHFKFRLGAMEGLSRAMKEIVLSPVYDDDGKELIPNRRIKYDTLVIAVGSVSNDFDIPGVKEHCIALDTQAEATVFHRKLVNACLRAQTQQWALTPGQLDVVIIGGGATGVELAAELHNTTRELAAYGLDRIDPDRDVKISIIEATSRVLQALPESLTLAVQKQLADLKVDLHFNKRVVRVDANGVYTDDGDFIPAKLVVWAAGIKAPDFLKNIDGLETNWCDQLVVKQTLQTTLDSDIFAFGDCAACPWPEQGEGQLVPPRAQAAHQQASMLLKSVINRINGRALPHYRYRDIGSLVNLGKYTTIGSLMGGLTQGSLFIQGSIARLMYQSLYKLHLLALHGWTKVTLDSIARMITRRTEPRVKLH